MMKLGTLISLKELLDAIGRSQPKYLRILDTSFQKQSVRNYLNEHVPGALFFDLNECRDKNSKYNIMLPSPTMFENYVGNLGIRNDTHVVLYENNDSGFYSTPRVWWTFRLFGHEKVSILSGGLQRWLAGNEPVTNEIPIVRQKPFIAAFKTSLVKNLGEIWQNRKDQSFQLVDARSTDCFNGQDKMPPGISACTIALAAFICGKEDISVYDGSWVEYYDKVCKEERTRSSELLKQYSAV